jgi:multicomponent Na+:H+ antiporter subunit G
VVAPLPVANTATTVVSIAADALVIVGIVVVTLGVIGAYRLPDVYTQLHATGKAVFLGIMAFLAALLAQGDGAIAARAALVAGFLILTTPVAAHVIARASFVRQEPMRTPGAIDESGRELNRRPDEPAEEEPPDAPRARFAER